MMSLDVWGKKEIKGNSCNLSLNNWADDNAINWYEKLKDWRRNRFNWENKGFCEATMWNVEEQLKIGDTA